MSAAIRAEELCGQLRRFYVKQIETGDAGEFSRMSDEELRAYVYGEKLPPKGETKHRLMASAANPDRLDLSA